MSRFAERAHCYVIAEAGSNHDGRYAQAEALIDAAVPLAAADDALHFANGFAPFIRCAHKMRERPERRRRCAKNRQDDMHLQSPRLITVAAA